MYNILFVDEDRKNRKKLIHIACSIFPDLECKETKSVEEAYTYIQTHDVKAIVMDIQGKHYDGLSFAKKVRELEAYYLVPIIIITKNQRLKLMAYEDIQCYSYIEKPVDVEEIRDVFERLFIGYQNLLGEEKEESLSISAEGRTLNIPLSQILYTEYHNRKITIVTENRDAECSHISMKKMESLLNASFLRVHQSFIVNKEHIGRIDYTSASIWLKNETRRIPIGRTYQKAVRDEMKLETITI